jgi:hypothetical protein
VSSLRAMANSGSIVSSEKLNVNVVSPPRKIKSELSDSPQINDGAHNFSYFRLRWAITAIIVLSPV